MYGARTVGLAKEKRALLDRRWSDSSYKLLSLKFSEKDTVPLSAIFAILIHRASSLCFLVRFLYSWTLKPISSRPLIPKHPITTKISCQTLLLVYFLNLIGFHKGETLFLHILTLTWVERLNGESQNWEQTHIFQFLEVSSKSFCNLFQFSFHSKQVCVLEHLNS